MNGREGEEDISLTPKHKQTSHIPGLSLAMHDADNEENASRRRIGIVETDSNYVKLAKQGGHKGIMLLLEVSYVTACDISMATILSNFLCHSGFFFTIAMLELLCVFPGLLWHEDTTLSVRKPTPYKPPAWFSNDTVDHMPLR